MTPEVASARAIAPPAEDARATTERAYDRAAELYGSGWWCGESVLKAVGEIAGSPLPPEVVRMASGFCEGFGGSRCTCGALAGAVMAAGMLTGRTSPEEPWEPSYDAAGELRRRFVDGEGTSTCDDIASRHGGMRHPSRWAHCADLCGRCAAWVVEITGDGPAEVARA